MLRSLRRGACLYWIQIVNLFGYISRWVGQPIIGFKDFSSVTPAEQAAWIFYETVEMSNKPKLIKNITLNYDGIFSTTSNVTHFKLCSCYFQCRSNSTWITSLYLFKIVAWITNYSIIKWKLYIIQAIHFSYFP